MEFDVTVLARDAKQEARWATELRDALQDLMEIQVETASSAKELGKILFVDSGMPDLDATLARIDRRGRAVFLIAGQGLELPPPLLDGRVDDVLVHPFRSLEVLSKIRLYQHLLAWDEVQKINDSFSRLLERLHDDLKLAERLQKAKLPVRFPEIKGFKIAHRYLAGMRAGGDHFDLAESRDANQFSIVLTDSSSYGLSSAVLSVLMRVAVKFSAEEARSSSDTVRKIHDELALTLGEKDRLSLFYASVSRKNFLLRYLNLGTSRIFYAKAGSGFDELPSQGAMLSRSSGFPAVSDGELQLDPGGRVVALSDGFVDAAGGSEKTRALLDQRRGKDAVDTLNELVFRVKNAFESPDDMPAQDCTGVIFDVDSKLIRLA